MIIAIFFSTERYLLARSISPTQGTVMRHIRQVYYSKHMTCQDNAFQSKEKCVFYRPKV